MYDWDFVFDLIIIVSYGGGPTYVLCLLYDALPAFPQRTTPKVLTDKTFEKETGEEIAIKYHLPLRDHKISLGNMRAAAGVMISSICLLHQGTFSFMTTPVPVTRGASTSKTPKESPYSRFSYMGCRLSSRSRDGDIDLNKAIANARTNLAEGRSPGAGLESAFDQADAAFADLVVTSVDQQGLNLDDEVGIIAGVNSTASF